MYNTASIFLNEDQMLLQTSLPGLWLCKHMYYVLKLCLQYVENTFVQFGNDKVLSCQQHRLGSLEKLCSNVCRNDTIFQYPFHFFNLIFSHLMHCKCMSNSLDQGT